MFPNFPENNKDDDFLNEFRQKLNDQSIANFEEKKNEINRSKNVFIGAVSGIALAAVVGWFVLSPRYANDPNVELPVIRRPQTAVKVQPTEPGGMVPIDPDCQCPTCRSFSRAYLRHLVKADEMLAMRLLVTHNLWFYNELMQHIRDALDQGEFTAFRAEYSEKLAQRL